MTEIKKEKLCKRCNKDMKEKWPHIYTKLVNCPDCCKTDKRVEKVTYRNK